MWKGFGSFERESEDLASTGDPDVSICIAATKPPAAAAAGQEFLSAPASPHLNSNTPAAAVAGEGPIAP